MKRKVTGAWKLITRNDHKEGDKSNIKYYSSKDNNNSYFPWVTYTPALKNDVPSFPEQK